MAKPSDIAIVGGIVALIALVIYGAKQFANFTSNFKLPDTSGITQPIQNFFGAFTGNGMLMSMPYQGPPLQDTSNLVPRSNAMYYQDAQGNVYLNGVLQSSNIIKPEMKNNYVSPMMQGPLQPTQIYQGGMAPPLAGTLEYLFGSKVQGPVLPPSEAERLKMGLAIDMPTKRGEPTIVNSVINYMSKQFEVKGQGVGLVGGQIHPTLSLLSLSRENPNLTASQLADLKFRLQGSPAPMGSFGTNTGSGYVFDSYNPMTQMFSGLQNNPVLKAYEAYRAMYA